MKRIAIALTSAAALPGAALAHGLHAPVPDHALAHLGPGLGLVVVIVAALVLRWRTRG